MNNSNYLNPNSNLSSPQKHQLNLNSSFTPFHSGQGVQPTSLHQQTMSALGGGGDQGQMHNVVLEHLKIGDEVVWCPTGKPLSIHKLDIGQVHRTFYHVDRTNQEALIAIVDFHDWVESSQEVRDHRGHRSFRLNVYAKHLRKLGEFLESVNSNGFQDLNNNGGRMGTANQNEGTFRSYVVRPCVLISKSASRHPVISESDPIFVFYNNTVVKGSVKRVFTGDGSYFVGAEFDQVVYPQQLAHDATCSFQSNGCERRIGIHISNLTKHIWESEFKLIVNGTKQLTFEDLFYHDEPPPSYFVATSTPTPVTHPVGLHLPPTAPPRTPSPPISFASWSKFNDVPEFTAKIIPEYPQHNWTPVQQPISISSLLSQSKNYSTSMMNLDSCKVLDDEKPVIKQKPNLIPKHQTNHQSLLVHELQRKLNIQPKPQPQFEPESIRLNVNYPLNDIEPTLEQTPTPTVQRFPLNHEATSFLDELKLRQRGKDRPGSLGPTSSKEQIYTKPQTGIQRLSLPPKPSPDPPSPTFVRPTGYVRSNTTSITGTGMSRSTSCMNISYGKTPTTPKPLLAPKPATKNVHQFTFPKSGTTKQNDNQQDLPISSKYMTQPQSKYSSQLSQTIIETVPHPIDKPTVPQSRILTEEFPPPPARRRSMVLSFKTEEQPRQPSHTNIPPSQDVIKISTPNLQELSPIKSKLLYPDLSLEGPPVLRDTKPSHTSLPIYHPPHSLPTSRFREEHAKVQPAQSTPSQPQPTELPKEINQDTKSKRISRENMPPPPPPPPPHAPRDNFVEDDSEMAFPPPPESWMDHDEHQFDETFENEISYDHKNPPPPTPAPTTEPQIERGSLLQQIRSGIQLRSIDEQSSPSPTSPNSTGLENIIKGAIETRRVQMDGGDQDSDGSDYDEDSDGWD